MVRSDTLLPVLAETTRARPEDFLELIEQRKRGRLKLYIGFAAGVGKTYRMLEEARTLHERGVDVVLGFVEPHGRLDTEKLMEGLPLIPRRKFEYRGVVVEEMDLDALLARRPEVALVDELAHTNVPLCRNKKRYQDVLELLGAGINVIGAFNVQHLEGLNDLVERVTGVTVRETIPDSFLRNADQVVNLDLAVEDLQERLKAGKIYAPEKVQQALTSFFRQENLSTLRELALREVAETLDRASGARHSGEQLGAAPGLGRVMVCLSSFPPRAAVLLRRGSRIAGRLNTDWFVVYVETPQEAPHLIDAEAQRHLLANMDKARELGAEVVRLHSKEPVQALIDFARSHGVGLIIVGRSHLPRWRSFFKLTTDLRLVREAQGIDVQVVSFDPREGRK